MALTPHDVARLGQLARIDLTPAELERFAPQLEVILESVARVSYPTDIACFADG